MWAIDVVPIHQYMFFSDISWGCSTQQRKIGQLDICHKMFSDDAAKKKQTKKQFKICIYIYFYV